MAASDDIVLLPTITAKLRHLSAIYGRMNKIDRKILDMLLDQPNSFLLSAPAQEQAQNEELQIEQAQARITAI